jgi:hypothetical protein
VPWSRELRCIRELEKGEYEKACYAAYSTAAVRVIGRMHYLAISWRMWRDHGPFRLDPRDLVDKEPGLSKAEKTAAREIMEKMVLGLKEFMRWAEENERKRRRNR